MRPGAAPGSGHVVGGSWMRGPQRTAAARQPHDRAGTSRAVLNAILPAADSTGRAASVEFIRLVRRWTVQWCHAAGTHLARRTTHCSASLAQAPPAPSPPALSPTQRGRSRSSCTTWASCTPWRGSARCVTSPPRCLRWWRLPTAEVAARWRSAWCCSFPPAACAWWAARPRQPQRNAMVETPPASWRSQRKQRWRCWCGGKRAPTCPSVWWRVLVTRSWVRAWAAVQRLPCLCTQRCAGLYYVMACMRSRFIPLSGCAFRALAACARTGGGAAGRGLLLAPAPAARAPPPGAVVPLPSGLATSTLLCLGRGRRNTGR